MPGFVCHPDFKSPFSSLKEACDRLLPYHVVVDYEAQEDDRIPDSDTTGQVLSRSQQWDHNIAAKVAGFTATFEKQALAFNMISRKQTLGEFWSEERLMIEQVLLQEERQAMLELRAETQLREKAGQDAHEAKLGVGAMIQVDYGSGPNSDKCSCPQGSKAAIGCDMGGKQEQGIYPDEVVSRWGHNTQRVS